MFNKIIQWMKSPIQPERVSPELLQARRQNELVYLQKEMMNSLCAVNGMNKCSSECVHFFPGRVGELMGEYYLSEPRCKLWACRD
jgi:hypothetical protein